MNIYYDHFNGSIEHPVFWVRCLLCGKLYGPFHKHSDAENTRGLCPGCGKESDQAAERLFREHFSKKK